MDKTDSIKPDFFGITTVAERGQVVIPKEARDALALAAGDKLVVLPSKRGDGILLMKEADIKKIAQQMSEKADHIIERSKKLQQKLEEAEDDK